MKYYTEKSLNNFEFWSGAKDTVEELTWNEIEQIESMLEDYFCDEKLSDTKINDFFWFERDTIAQWLGYSSFDELMKREK